MSAEQPCFKPKQAIFPLNIETGFIVNAPVTSNTAALSIYFKLPNNHAGWNKHAGWQISQN